MRHFCTYFNVKYLSRGLALYRSLALHETRDFVLWVLCFDDTAYKIVSTLKSDNLRPVALADFERGDDALLAAKQSRTLVEYYFTCSPSWPLYLINQFPEIDQVTYVDADLFFWSDPQPIFGEMGSGSILIIPHRFPPHLRHMELHGIYNVGLLSFRNDKLGRECLEWWRARCLEWCYDRIEDGKFADQKYLDDWPTRFEGAVVLSHKGANLAPWNWMNYQISERNGQIIVDNQPLIFYHYQGLKVFNRWLYDPGVTGYGPMPPAIRRLLYRPYIHALNDAYCWARSEVGALDPGYATIHSRSYGWRRLIKGLLQRQITLSLG
jgi:hypothetical protein